MGNVLLNGRFLGQLDAWTASNATYDATAGGVHLGCASLAVGGSVSQPFAPPESRTYDLTLSVYPVGAALTGEAEARVLDETGTEIAAFALVGDADEWTPQSFSLGLAGGRNYTLRIVNVAADGVVKVDDVVLAYSPITRAAAAAETHARLGRLASERGYSTAASGALTEGTYTYAINAALRELSATDPDTGLPDVRWLQPAQVNDLIDLAERYMLEQLLRDYAVEVDITVGQRRENLSQIAGRLAQLTGPTGGEQRRVVTRKLRYDIKDFSL